MAEEAVKAMLSSTAHIENMLQDMLNELLKIAKEKAEINRERDFRSDVTDEKGQKGARMYSLDRAINGRIVKALCEKGIPYVDFNVKDTPKSVVIIPKRYQADMDRIVSNVRMQIGLTLDSKDELKAAILMEANKNRQEYGQLRELYGLSAEMAGRLMHFAQKNGIPAVMEKQAENSFSVFTPADKAIREKVDRLFFAAAWDVSGLSGQAEKPRSAYAAQERFEIMHALERTGEKMTDAYVFSASQPGNYIHIEESGFTIYDGGKAIMAARKSDDLENYEESLKWQCLKRYENPVYMLKEEVMEKGGPVSGRITEELKKTFFTDNISKNDLERYAAEKTLRNFLQERFHAGITETDQEKMLLDGTNEFRKHMEQKMAEDPQRADVFRKILRLSMLEGNDHIREALEVINSSHERTEKIYRNPLIYLDQYMEITDYADIQTIERGEFYETEKE